MLLRALAHKMRARLKQLYVISSDYINDYSVAIGCGNDATYTLRITIVPKVERIKTIPSSKLCKPDAPDLIGIENNMPDLVNVSERAG